MEGARTHFNLEPLSFSHLWAVAPWERFIGRHIYQDAVAIKVLNQDLARDEWALNAFTNEVRAAAGLNHPNIMMLLDQGVVTPEEADNANGQARSGSPYLVMELVEGRPLHHWAGRLSWPIIHNVLSQCSKPSHTVMHAGSFIETSNPEMYWLRFKSVSIGQIPIACGFV